VTRTMKMLIAVVALAGALAAYWMLVLSPKREEIAKLDKGITKAKADLSATEATLATYEKARGAYKRNYATVVRLGKAVPGDDDVRSLVVQLDSAAERSGVDFNSIQVTDSSSGPKVEAEGATTGPPGSVAVGDAGFTAMPFTFAFDGPFDNMSTFFARLERFVSANEKRLEVTGRLLRVESISLKPDEKGFPNIRAEIGASSYLLPSGEGVTAGGGPEGPGTAEPAQAAEGTPDGGSTPPTTTATSTGAIR